MRLVAGAEGGKKKKKKGLDEATEVSHVVSEHRYTPAADLFVS